MKKSIGSFIVVGIFFTILGYCNSKDTTLNEKNITQLHKYNFSESTSNESYDPIELCESSESESPNEAPSEPEEPIERIYESCKPICPPPPPPPKPCIPCCDPCEPCPPCCNEKPKTNQPCECAYNAPARIDPACGWRAWIDGSFIYWLPKEKGTDIGNHIINIICDGITKEKKQRLNLSTDYKPGFKVGFGFSMYKDDWTLYMEYTRLKSVFSNKFDLGDAFNVVNNFLSSFWIITNSEYKLVKAKWSLNFNIFDLKLGRPYFLGKKLIFKPSFGLRGGWIDQKYVSNAMLFNSERLVFINNFRKNKLESWLVGPRATLETDWKLAYHFRVFGNAGAAITYQEFKTSFFETNSIDSIINGNDKTKYLTPNADLALGLGWGNYFCNYEWYFDLCIGYEFNYFWNQNFMRNFNDFSTFFGPDADEGNLYFHGLTLTARLDF